MNALIKTTKAQMEQRIAAMEKEYSTLRAGRPTKALFSNITVQQHGAPMAITHVATVSIPEAHQVVIKPWDPSMIDGITKAILSSPLSLNPVSDGKLIRIQVPPLSEERRHEYAKIAKTVAENGKIAIRTIRREANEKLKTQLKEKEIAEDEEHRLLDEVQKITDDITHKIDELLVKKEKEIIDN